MNLLALTKYGDRAACARQRFIQYNDYLRSYDITMQCSPLLDNDYLDAIFSKRAAARSTIIRTYAARLQQLLRGHRSDGIWIQKELFPYAPGLFESAILPNTVPVILDYDDAVFHQYDQHGNRIVRTLLGGKLKPLLRRAGLAICGNEYLQGYAARYCRRTEIVPTVVDTGQFTPRTGPMEARPVTIGWIGSPSTWRYAEPLVPLLRTIAEAGNLAIRVVGAGPQTETPPRFEFLNWSEAGEIPLIQGMDIGIMPLPDEPWARGKCGYKLIQYMACGLPVVASPVGVNSRIVDHGCNGFLATTPSEWARALSDLANDASLRRKMGASGRKKIEWDYSLAAHGPRLARMVHELLEAGQHRNLSAA